MVRSDFGSLFTLQLIGVISGRNEEKMIERGFIIGDERTTCQIRNPRRISMKVIVKTE
jgi:hypothetical protein